MIKLAKMYTVDTFSGASTREKLTHTLAAQVDLAASIAKAALVASLGIVSFFGASQAAVAAWELDSMRSSVQFMSVKNSTVAELHYFKVLSGGIAEGGQAQLMIDLDSVETLVPIRNQRMRELLFETVRFPAATMTVDVSDDLLALEAGQSESVSIPVNIDLHGVSASYPAKVLVTGLADGGLQVVLREPLLIKAADFELADGIGVLREVAGLKAISTAVPVSATLVFTEE